MHDDFRVAACAKRMPPSLETGTQLLKIVDLAVEDHHNRAVFVRHGLVAAGKILDAQAPHAKGHVATVP